MVKTTDEVPHSRPPSRRKDFLEVLARCVASAKSVLSPVQRPDQSTTGLSSKFGCLADLPLLYWLGLVRDWSISSLYEEENLNEETWISSGQ